MCNTPVAVRVLFYRSNHRKVDIDNLLKAVMDALTSARIWNDDSQVCEITARRWMGESNPRVEITVYTISDP